MRNGGQVYASQHSLSGVAVDGYISGATTCLDLNVNGTCDESEPSVTTASDGSFTFSNVAVDANALFSVIVSGGIDTATNEAFSGELKNIVDTTALTSSTKLNVSPLTDLVATSFLKSDTKTREQLSTTRTKVATALSLNIEDIESDPMGNATVFAKTQEVQQMKTLLESTASKAMGTTLSEEQTKTLRKDITHSIVTQIEESTTSTLEVSKVLTKVEERTNISIPENEKTFITAQVVEIKTTLQSITTTSVSIEQLSTIQSSLEEQQKSALTQIANATNDSALNVVTITTPVTSTVERSPTVNATGNFLTPPTTPIF